MDYPFSIKEKKVLVVGGANGIGAVISRKLLEFDSLVIVIDQKISEEFSKINDLHKEKLIYIEQELSRPEQLNYALDKLDNFAGVIDGVVFCHGISGWRPLRLTNSDFVTQMFIANVFLFIELLRLVSKRKILADGSGIVALSSVSSKKGLKSKAAYSASKAALDAAVRSSAAEFSTRSIRVNSIQKGWVSTDMQLQQIRNNMVLSDDSDLKRQLLGVIEPEDIAYSVIYLLSDASRKITGTSILLDGGYCL